MIADIVFREVVDPIFVNDVLDFEDNPVVEHYGGVVKTVTLETATNEDVISERFPYSCSIVSDECSKDQKYLVPSSSKKSIAYWEIIGPAATVEHPYVPNALEMTYNMRFVFWADTKKLGNESCDPVIYTIPFVDAIEEVNGSRATNILRLDIDVESIQYDEEVFDQYTYLPNYRQFLKQPYVFFGINYTVKISLFRKCLKDFTTSAPIEC